MANSEHLEILKQGVKKWNAWRKENPSIRPNFRDEDLTGLKFSSGNFSGADFAYSLLWMADFRGADLQKANFIGADLRGADFTSANLAKADLRLAQFRRVTLNKADLNGSNLEGSLFIESTLNGANLTNCRVYGISVWNVETDVATRQIDLIITHEDETALTVDDLEVAQFIYLLLNNKKIKNVINTITSKVVLILGRFTPERKNILDALRAEIRQHNYSPILFDFDKPESKDVTGTVETLARMARFIIADLTDPSSIPHELATVVPYLRTTPVQPLRLAGSGGYSMFDDLKIFPWVLKTYEYKTSEKLIAALNEKVISPAEAKFKKLTKSRSRKS